MKRITKLILLGLASTFFIFGAVLYLHNVPTSITDEDEIYIHKILNETGNRPPINNALQPFDKEIALIQTVQKSAFDTAPGKEVLSVNNPREPKDLYNAQAAYCGDRSRYIYKALKHFGYDVRYASVYNDLPDKTLLGVMTTRGKQGAKSHALVEVKTSKGWMAVDSRTHWISLTKNGAPVSISALQAMAENGEWPEWSDKNEEDIYFLMKKPFHIIYGLYSRHGRFYAPYTPYIPDVDWSEFLLNFKH